MQVDHIMYITRLHLQFPSFIVHLMDLLIMLMCIHFYLCTWHPALLVSLTYHSQKQSFLRRYLEITLWSRPTLGNKHTNSSVSDTLNWVLWVRLCLLSKSTMEKLTSSASTGSMRLPAGVQTCYEPISKTLLPCQKQNINLKLWHF